MILHADLDSFYASVEQRDDPALRDRPVLVGGGVVLAASYEAKACGVRTPMSLSRARALCPQAIVVPPRMTAYAAASKAVFAVFRDTTPIVEPISIDEAFLGVDGLRRISGTAEEIARRLRADVRARVGLPITVGVAGTKFLAKVASGAGKPDGLLVVPPGGELAFLHPLPVEKLWGVGPKTADRLRERQIRTVGDVARVGEAALIAMLGGNTGRHLHALAHNHDPRRVGSGGRRGSIGAQCALGRGRRAPEDVEAVLAALVDRVTHRMRGAHRAGRTVTLRLRFDDFQRVTRSRSLLKATLQTGAVLRLATDLLREARPLIDQRGLTLIGVAVSNLDGEGGVQLELPFEAPRQDGLDAAVDRVRDRFGASALRRADMLGREMNPSVPILPD
ncbi:DNA polymerase IV [Actinoplanes sp. SE50]|uniref:DNA polymerase IV n=1 Tax=unclassified Actinoplanes TaxID=2626549 RepID=UPI00023ECF5D|nr:MULTISPECIES: DNA polymerase IV [unclassified Actinoplanes]AEV87773.1 DNA polymerase IV [Actinoplanes sp. SE50/110]ATO86175.1 DNA polymerase IV [Actinoplanes sp. SE50]SLM03589.1 DNA polymerase IV [Actinoplanes sp. SE50/110]